MRCCVFHHQPQPLSPFLLPRLKCNRQFRRPQLFFSPSTSRLGDHPRPSISFRPLTRFKLRLNASAVPPAESGDLTTFLQVSGGLIFLYWIANFVVPDLISKYFQFDKVNQEHDSDN